MDPGCLPARSRNGLRWPSRKLATMENQDSRNVPVPLVYEGTCISARNETLSLTDMWRAAGLPDTKRPADWLALSSTAEFREAVEATFDAGKSGIKTVKGSGSGGGRGGGATFAHWQIALAYAKYLSPEFHMWCNTVVRERMEGRRPTLPADVAEEIARTFGICRQLSHKVTEIEKAIPVLIGQTVEAALASDPRRAVLDYVSVRQLLDEAKAERKGRNRVNRKIGFEMRTIALTRNPPAALRRCPHSNVWLYPRAFANEYMAARGSVLVREHNDAVKGQGVLQLVRKAKPATPAEDSANDGVRGPQ